MLFSAELLVVPHHLPPSWILSNSVHSRVPNLPYWVGCFRISIVFGANAHYYYCSNVTHSLHAHVIENLSESWIGTINQSVSLVVTW